MASKGFLNVTASGRQYNIGGEKPSVILFLSGLVFCMAFNNASLQHKITVSLSLPGTILD